MKKIKTVTIDTLTSIQDNEYMLAKKKADFDKWRDFGVDVYTLCHELRVQGFDVILILGDPGTGKSTGMRNLDPETNMWFNADNKNPVWLGGRKAYGKTSAPKAPYHIVPITYSEITSAIQETLDANMFEEDRVAFVIGHIETYKQGLETKLRLKTLGNLTNKMQVEGKLEAVLYSEVKVEGGKTSYVLATQNNGLNSARSPQGMFEDDYIENDYQKVVDAIDAYNGAE